MTPIRREFIVIATAAGLGLLSEKTARARTVPKARESLRILVLGGTGYIGPYQVRYAVERGHIVTLWPLAVTALDTLNWSKTQPEERGAEPRFGLAPEREVEVLAAWNAREDGQG